MKAFALLLVAVLLVNAALGKMDLSFSTAKALRLKDKPLAAPPVACNICVQFMEQTINELLQIILEGGILGGCVVVCAALPNQYEVLICNLLCDAVGVEAFGALIQDTDPDPVWICMEVDACASTLTAAATITANVVQPPVAKRNQEVQFGVAYTIINQTGTSDLAIVIVPPSEGEALEGDWLQFTQAPGQYQQAVSLKLKPNQYQPFLDGTYVVQWFVCEGLCGCIHNLCYTLAQSQTTLKISG